MTEPQSKYEPWVPPPGHTCWQPYCEACRTPEAQKPAYEPHTSTINPDPASDSLRAALAALDAQVEREHGGSAPCAWCAAGGECGARLVVRLLERIQWGWS